MTWHQEFNTFELRSESEKMQFVCGCIKNGIIMPNKNNIWL